MDDNVVDLEAHRAKIEDAAALKLEKSRKAIKDLIPIFDELIPIHDPDQLPWVNQISMILEDIFGMSEEE